MVRIVHRTDLLTGQIGHLGDFGVGGQLTEVLVGIAEQLVAAFLIQTVDGLHEFSVIQSHTDFIDIAVDAGCIKDSKLGDEVDFGCCGLDNEVHAVLCLDGFAERVIRTEGSVCLNGDGHLAVRIVIDEFSELLRIQLGNGIFGRIRSEEPLMLADIRSVDIQFLQIVRTVLCFDRLYAGCAAGRCCGSGASAYQRQRDAGEGDDRDQRDNEQADIRHNILRNGHDRQFTDTAGNEEVDADGRCNETDGQVDDHHDTEVDLVYADSAYDGPQDGRQQQDRGTAVHDHSDEEQEDVHDEKDHEFRMEGSDHEITDHRGDLQHGHDLCKCCGSAEHEQQRAVSLHGFLQDGRDILDFQRSVNEQTDDQSVENGDRGSLGRRSDTAVNGTEDDNGRKQCPEAGEEDLHEASLTKLGNFFIDLLFIFAVLQAVEYSVDHQAACDQEAGKDTGGEHLADRGFGVRHAVQDHRDRRRDDNTEGTGDADGRYGKLSGITQIQQDRDGHGTDSRDSCGSGTGDGAVEQAGYDDRAGHTAGDLTDKIGKEIEQLTGNTAAGHNDTGQNEHRDSQQREAVHAFDGVSDKADGRNGIHTHETGCQRSDRHRAGNRNGGEQTDDENDKQ